MLTTDQAAAIARRNGLSLNDAAGLLTLADNEVDAERIAQKFRSEDGEFRSFVQGLFSGPPKPTGFFADEQEPA